jgi:hypothetical protein
VYQHPVARLNLLHRAMNGETGCQGDKTPLFLSILVSASFPKWMDVEI